MALIVQARAVAAGFARLELGGHSLKRGALMTGMDCGVHPTKLKRLGRHKVTRSSASTSSSATCSRDIRTGDS